MTVGTVPAVDSNFGRPKGIISVGMELQDLNEFDRLRLDHSIFDGVAYGEASERQFNRDDGEDHKEYVAPVMPEEFYQKVEGFLTQPAPKVVNLTVKPKKHQPSVGVKDLKPKVQSFTALKVRTNDNSDHRAKGGSSKELNLDLLQQAFAYSEKLAREALEDEESAVRVGDSNNSSNNITAFKTTNALIETSSMKSKQRHVKPRATGSEKNISIVKRLRDQTKQNSNPKFNKSEDATLSNSFSVQSMPEEDIRRTVLDFDSLISNFQTGANISKLRQELMQSQQSKSNSEQYMRQIAAEFNLNGGRR